jgi:hypothetical protein
MGSVKKLANEIHLGFLRIFPALRKRLQDNIPLLMAAMVEGRTANTAVLAAYLPLDITRRDLREQWLRRQLSSKFLNSVYMMKPFAVQILRESTKFGQVIQLSMDQTDVGDRFAILVISIRLGDRALPLTWKVEQGAANIGFEGQSELLEQILSWIPKGAQVMLSADRFYPSKELFKWLKLHQWQHRLRLKGNYLADIGRGDLMTTGVLAEGHQERYEGNVSLFESEVMTNIGILHEPGHKEPWIIAMDCQPTRAKVLDYSSRWCIEPMFSDFKTRGFGLEDTHIENPQRVDNLILIMALAMYWCVSVGYEDALNNLTTVEKKSREHAGTNHWAVRKAYRSALSWFQRGLRILISCAQNSQPVPEFVPLRI